MNNVQIFDGLKAKEVDGKIWLDAESVAIGLGISQTKNGVVYVQWRRINNYLSGVSAQMQKENNSTQCRKVISSQNNNSTS